MKLKRWTQKMKAMFLPVLLLASTGVLAQTERTVSGTVFSAADNISLIGATISVKGTPSGTSTDADGNFTISVDNLDAILEVSYIGFITKELPVSASPMTIFLDVE